LGYLTFELLSDITAVMDSFLRTTVGAISFILVTGIVGFVLAVGWYRATARGPLEKATIYSSAKFCWDLQFA
jgi:hypothetical protein